MPNSPTNLESPDKSPRKREESIKQPSQSVQAEIDFPWVVMKEKIPSGEMILKLFGRILFETAEINVYFN